MNRLKLRKPAVSGQFYNSSAAGLKNQIDGLVDKQADKVNAVACLLPHAGYMYSGLVAAQTVSRLKLKIR